MSRVSAETRSNVTSQRPLVGVVERITQPLRHLTGRPSGARAGTARTARRAGISRSSRALRSPQPDRPLGTSQAATRQRVVARTPAGRAARRRPRGVSVTGTRTLLSAIVTAAAAAARDGARAEATVRAASFAQPQPTRDPHGPAVRSSNSGQRMRNAGPDALITMGYGSSVIAPSPRQRKIASSQPPETASAARRSHTVPGTTCSRAAAATTTTGGGPGDDRLSGGASRDDIYPGGGGDTVVCGGGPDSGRDA